MSVSARTRVRFVGITAVFAALLTVGATAAAAAFSAQAEVPATASTATLLPVPSAQAIVDAEGIERVSWDAPALNGGSAMKYKLTRSIDGAPATVVTDGLFARSSTQDLSVAATSEPRTATDVSAGGLATCAVVGGEILCWGLVPPVGTESTRTPTAIPKPVGAEDLDFTAVSAGSYHGCAIMENGAAYCWGAPGGGRLGTSPILNGDTTVPVPVAHPGTTGQVFVQIRAADEYNCAILADPGETVGDIYCWGVGQDGQLGHGQNSEITGLPYGPGANRSVPTKVHAPNVNMKFSTVSTSERHACAVSVAGGPYCWGNNVLGAVGQYGSGVVGSPFRVRGSEGQGSVAKDIATGGNTSCAVMQTSVHAGEIVCWGQFVGNDFLTPITVPGLTNENPAVSIYGGQSQTLCATLLDGQTACWGDNTGGQAGNSLDRGAKTAAALLVSPVGAEDVGFAKVDVGNQHSCGLLTNGRVACWGTDTGGSLGTPGTSALLTPTLVNLGGQLICAEGWLKAILDQDKCVPGPSVNIQYDIGYTLQGWSPPTAKEITATYQ